MTAQGCRDTKIHETECDAKPTGWYLPQYDVCIEYFDCPASDPMFEGCNTCEMMHNWNSNPMMDCSNCKKDYF